MPPSLHTRLLASFFAALCAAGICYTRIRHQGYATDFAWFWLSGRALIEGHNPYEVIHAGVVNGMTLDNGFVYPLPAAVASVPFALFSPFVGSLVFVATGAFVLVFALTREDWTRWPIALSFPMLWAVSSGQWSPFVTAAALSPWFGFMAAVKPTLGAAAWLRKPSVKFLAVGAAFTILAFLVNPLWPLDWLRAIQSGARGFYHVPVVVSGGLLLLVAIRWRSPEGRLLLGMACVPSTMLPYDHLALGLIARTRIQAYVVSLWSYLIVPTVLVVQRYVSVTDKAQSLHVLSYIIVSVYYVPALGYVLYQPPRSAHRSGRLENMAVHP